ncbi:tautomerase family protein [Jannaschia sp. CCS1]|uniref:tautomerase family protein n=1 Tax=Jannaschia sp. (strain CCS1) TaxID=290400 RepID=UPI000053B262|nr:tautomerase family protein [Jannaschia sp. CCS1]
MPSIRLTVPKDAWSQEEKGELIATLTDAMAGFASEEGKGDIRQFVSVYVEETAAGGYSIGGNVLG